MAAKLTLSKIPLDLLPAGNKFFTVSYGLKDSGSYTVKSNNVEVLPNGDLVTPLVIDNLIEGQWYDIFGKSNCSNVSFKKVFQMPLSAGAPVTLKNTTVYPLQFYVDGVLKATMAIGETKTIAATEFSGAAQVLHIKFADPTPAPAAGDYFSIGRRKTDGTVTVFTAQFDETLEADVATTIVLTGEVLTISDRSSFLKKTNYTAGAGTYSGSSGWVTISRSVAAAGDASFLHKDVTVEFKVTDSKGNFKTVSVVFDDIYLQSWNFLVDMSVGIEGNTGTGDIYGTYDPFVVYIISITAI